MVAVLICLLVIFVQVSAEGVSHRDDWVGNLTVMCLFVFFFFSFLRSPLYSSFVFYFVHHSSLDLFLIILLLLLLSSPSPPSRRRRYLNSWEHLKNRIYIHTFPTNKPVNHILPFVQVFLVCFITGREWSRMGESGWNQNLSFVQVFLFCFITGGEWGRMGKVDGTRILSSRWIRDRLQYEGK